MNRATLPVVAAACLVLVASPRRSYADGYAAMDEVPVKGAELRLDIGVTVTHGGVARRVVRYALKRMNMDINVAGTMAEYTVEQVFKNPLNRPIEAVYSGGGGSSWTSGGGDADPITLLLALLLLPAAIFVRRRWRR